MCSLRAILHKLLNEYPGPKIQSVNLTAPYTVAPPVVVDRLLALERGDYTFRGGKDHLMGRVSIARVAQPDFIWTPYPAFVTPLNENTEGAAANWTHTWSPRLTSELKVGYSDDNLWWNRAQPQVPALASYDGVDLPGSPSAYSYRNHNRTPEAIYSTVWTRNRHIVSAGAGFLFRMNNGYQTVGQDGIYYFANAISFAFDSPEFFQAAVSRTSSTPALPNYNRSYSYQQNYFFLQDSYRATSRLTLNYGIRYERYGAPANTGAAKDTLLELGAGSNLTTRLATATLMTPTSGNEQIFGADNGDIAPRFGFSLDPFGKGNTILRGGFGMFYDRPFDNLWQNVRNNGYVIPFYSVSGAPVDYLQSVSSVLPTYANQNGAVANANFPGITLMDPNLKNGYVESFFLGAEQRVGDNLTIQVTGDGSLGRRLITTDIVNRQYTVTSGLGQPNPALPDVSWRSSQGLSDYYALDYAGPLPAAEFPRPGGLYAGAIRSITRAIRW